MGYFMQKFGFEPAPLALAYVLSPMLETALRQSLNISGGNFSIFFSRPISLVALVLAGVLIAFQVCTPLLREMRSKRKDVS
jgi:putative tricarboxylic transport membrane protein